VSDRLGATCVLQGFGQGDGGRRHGLIGLPSKGEGRKILEKHHRVGLRRQVAPLGGAGGEYGKMRESNTWLEQ